MRNNIPSHQMCRSPSRYLTDDQIKEIRNLYSDRKIPTRIIADKYNVSQAYISRLLLNKARIGIYKGKLLADEVKEIRNLFEDGISMSKLAKHFKVSECSIRSIVNGHSWRYI